MTAYLGANLHHTDKRLQQSGPAVPRPRPTVTPTPGHATQPRSMGGGRRRRAPHQYSPRGRGLPTPGSAPAQRDGGQGAGRVGRGRGRGRGGNRRGVAEAGPAPRRALSLAPPSGPAPALVAACPAQRQSLHFRTTHWGVAQRAIDHASSAPSLRKKVCRSGWNHLQLGRGVRAVPSEDLGFRASRLQLFVLSGASKSRFWTWSRRGEVGVHL